MSRYIDADAVKEALKQNTPQYMWGEVLTTVNIQPYIELDLVTCAECKFKSLYDGETKYYYCALEDRPNRNWSVDDWNYCYWGERKENE